MTSPNPQIIRFIVHTTQGLSTDTVVGYLEVEGELDDKGEPSLASYDRGYTTLQKVRGSRNFMLNHIANALSAEIERAEWLGKVN